MTLNLLPVLEAYITGRISDLAKFHANPEQSIRELENVRTLCRGLVKLHDFLEQRFAPPQKSSAAITPDKTFPFECDNCGHKPTAQEVVDYKGECVKCGDSVITYTVDAAECILQSQPNKL